MKKLTLISISLLVSITTIIAQQNDFPKLAGPYLGQTPPVNEQELFAPGIVSTKAGNHSTVTINPDGKELIWSMKGKIWFTKLENGYWTEPKILSFCKEDPYSYDNPFISPDGKRMFFTSFRPGAVSQEKENIWYIEKNASGWSSDPIPVSSDVNEMRLHWSISVSNPGTLYFQFQNTPDSEGGIGDIYYSNLVNGAYTKPVKMGAEINTPYTETCPYIAPDESYIIFNRMYETPKNSGLYISYRDRSGRWLPAVFAYGGSTTKGGISPKISPDGKYVFFANGSDGMWWMPAGFIEELRPEELKNK